MSRKRKKKSGSPKQAQNTNQELKNEQELTAAEETEESKTEAAKGEDSGTEAAADGALNQSVETTAGDEEKAAAASSVTEDKLAEETAPQVSLGKGSFPELSEETELDNMLPEEDHYVEMTAEAGYTASDSSEEAENVEEYTAEDTAYDASYGYQTPEMTENEAPEGYAPEAEDGAYAAEQGYSAYYEPEEPYAEESSAYEEYEEGYDTVDLEKVEQERKDSVFSERGRKNRVGSGTEILPRELRAGGAGTFRSTQQPAKEDYPEEDRYEENEGSVDLYEEPPKTVRTVSKSKSKSRDYRREDDASFGSFVTNLWQDIRGWVSENRSACAIALVIVAAVIISVILINGSKKDQPVTGLETASNNTVIDPAVSGAEETIQVPRDPLEEDAYPEVNALVSAYFAARENNDLEAYKALRSFTGEKDEADFRAKAEYIEEYRNLKCYTKKGPFDNSYIVYVTFDLKLKDWEQTAPGQLTLVVCTRDDGSLYVYSDSNVDENVADYIRMISSQQDVVDLNNRIQSEYQSVIDQNPEFAEYMESLTRLLHDSVGLYLAEARENAQAQEAANTSSEGDDGGSETTDAQQETQNGGSFLVQATDNVNVRASDSQNADRLGRVTAGTQLTCYEQMANGWSKVEYEGQTAYINSDYLIRVGETNHGGNNNTVTATSTVNIRATADTDGDKLGVAYAGDEFELVERGPEWTKIIYQGQEAYIKSDYIN